MTLSPRDWLVTRKDALELRRRIVFSRAGRVGIAQRFEVARSYGSTLATARSWFASLVVGRDGALGFRDARGARPMAAPRFTLFVPAGALVRMPLERAEVETIGISGRELPPGIPSIPMAVPCDL